MTLLRLTVRITIEKMVVRDFLKTICVRKILKLQIL